MTFLCVRLLQHAQCCRHCSVFIYVAISTLFYPHTVVTSVDYHWIYRWPIEAVQLYSSQQYSYAQS